MTQEHEPDEPETEPEDTPDREIKADDGGKGLEQ